MDRWFRIPLWQRVIAALVLDRGMADAVAVSYSKASSNASLPVTLRCVERNPGVNRSVSGFVVSLGATVNMNGGAMYFGLVALFGAQISGVSLDVFDYSLIAITSVLIAIGAAGVPGGGLIMMGTVLTSVGVPLETIAFAAGVDRIMDIIGTTTNIAGDAVVAVAVARTTGEIHVQQFASADDV
jgi:Na+/H+-dicarboxylate symporter